MRLAHFRLAVSLLIGCLAAYFFKGSSFVVTRLTIAETEE